MYGAGRDVSGARIVDTDDNSAAKIMGMRYDEVAANISEQHHFGTPKHFVSFSLLCFSEIKRSSQRLRDLRAPKHQPRKRSS